MRMAVEKPNKRIDFKDIVSELALHAKTIMPISKSGPLQDLLFQLASSRRPVSQCTAQAVFRAEVLPRLFCADGCV